jgi:hypothetical protein
VVTTLLAAAVFVNTGRREARAPRALLIRVMLAEVSLRMWATHPIAGVGIGRFQTESKDFIPPELVAIFPPAARGENAHDNFLQILVSLGAVGFAAFSWLIFAPGRAALRALASRPRDPVLLGFFGGAAAFLFTCLSSHPLLTHAVLLTFLLVLGVVSGLAAGAGFASRPSPRAAWVVAGASAAVLLSVPVRALQARRAADLDHVVLGVSRPAGVIDGVTYRLLDARSIWYLSASARVAMLPVRLDGDSGPCQVALTLDGVPADVVAPSRRDWLTITLPLPPAATGRTSRRLDLATRGDGCRVLVGALVEKE